MDGYIGGQHALLRCALGVVSKVLKLEELSEKGARKLEEDTTSL